MSASDECAKRITISLWSWARLVVGLRVRGEGRRESGAFLLGKWNGTSGKVMRVVFYDDLDPNAYQNGIITFHGEGLAALWAICRGGDLEVIADCHTHGNANTGQSVMDQRNPMIPDGAVVDARRRRSRVSRQLPLAPPRQGRAVEPHPRDTLVEGRHGEKHLENFQAAR